MSVERFKISARLMTHLGEALISDELVALMELIKNSYDADANFSRVVVDSKYSNGEGIIVVEDDGSGMDRDIIVNSFLVLATDFKIKTQKKSPKYNRLALGNKGIGRLSLQRLGEKCTVVSKKEDKDAYSFSINWEDFYDADKEIYDILIDVKETPEMNDYFKKGHGTKIEIRNIKNISLWESKGTFIRFKNEILSIINPYSNDDEKFVISIDLDGERMTSDRYDVNLIKQCSDVTACFEYISFDNKITIELERQKKYIDWLLATLDLPFYSEEFDIKVNKERVYQRFLNEVISFNLDEAHKIFPYISDKDYRLNNLFLPGDFKGAIYAFDKAASRFTKETRDFLDSVNGVKLFRNNFRILPYGDAQNDWLFFTKYSQTLKANIYKNHTTCGHIYIDGEENLAKIREMTNRQGILLDEYGESFLTICRTVISRILVQKDIECKSAIIPEKKELGNIKYGESRSFCDGIVFTRKNNSIAGATAALSEMKRAIETSGISSKTIESSLRQATLQLGQAKSQLENEKQYIASQQKSIDEFKITIGSALISEFMAHEIARTVNSSLENINRVKELTSKTDVDRTSINVLLDTIKIHLNYLAKYASVIDLNSYSKRRKREVIDLKAFLKQIVDDMPFLSDSNSNIKCLVNGDDCECEIIKTNFTIAIENILINSKYWLDRFDVKDKTITISINSSERKIIVFDNGLGIYKQIEKKVFEAFVSAKPDNEGRGIGLYITDKLLEEMGMKISLDEERNEYNQLYKFVISF